MKPDYTVLQNESSEEPIVGDVIGDTTYSQRFVLKILLKIANLDTFKNEIEDKSFEDDLCTLWDMTAERDVVLFLQKYEILNLVNFALPVVKCNRILEIIIGIIGNMCCHREVVTDLMEKYEFSIQLLQHLKSDDPLVLIQVLRLVNSGLFLVKEEELPLWMEFFEKTYYSDSLYFILNNSSNRELLITALENLNTICSYCNIISCRTAFFTHFVTESAIKSTMAAFTEIAVCQKELSEKDELERVLIISLQITLNIIGFENSQELYTDDVNDVINVVSTILHYYENKIEHNEIDSEIVDIIDSVNTILNIFDANVIFTPEKYFRTCYKIWKALCKDEKKSGCSFEEDNEKVEEVVDQIKTPLSTLLCSYMNDCSESNLWTVLDEIGEDYDILISYISDKKITTNLTNKVSQYKARLANC